MKKHVRAAGCRVHILSHTFSPVIGRGVKVRVVVGKSVSAVQKNSGAGIGQRPVWFEDDLTAGLVEEWNREVDGARASLG